MKLISFIVLLLFSDASMFVSQKSSIKGSILGIEIDISHIPLEEGKNSIDFKSSGAWSPSQVGPALMEFSQSIRLTNQTIPRGKYAVYFESDKPEWKIILNKKLTAGYDHNFDFIVFKTLAGEISTKKKQSEWLINAEMKFIIFNWLNKSLIIPVGKP